MRFIETFGTIPQADAKAYAKRTNGTTDGRSHPGDSVVLLGFQQDITSQVLIRAAQMLTAGFSCGIVYAPDVAGLWDRIERAQTWSEHPNQTLLAITVDNLSKDPSVMGRNYWVLRGWDGSAEALEHAVHEYQPSILTFATHGREDTLYLKGSTLCGRQRTAVPQSTSHLPACAWEERCFRDRPTLIHAGRIATPFMFLNACMSGHPQGGLFDPNYSILNGFFEGGSLAILAAPYVVSGGSAYNHLVAHCLLNGMTIGQTATLLNATVGLLGWEAPGFVLFGDPDLAVPAPMVRHSVDQATAPSIHGLTPHRQSVIVTQDTVTDAAPEPVLPMRVERLMRRAEQVQRLHQLIFFDAKGFGAQGLVRDLFQRLRPLLQQWLPIAMNDDTWASIEQKLWTAERLIDRLQETVVAELVQRTHTSLYWLTDEFIDQSRVLAITPTLCSACHGDAQAVVREDLLTGWQRRFVTCSTCGVTSNVPYPDATAWLPQCTIVRPQIPKGSTVQVRLVIPTLSIGRAPTFIGVALAGGANREVSFGDVQTLRPSSTSQTIIVESNRIPQSITSHNHWVRIFVMTEGHLFEYTRNIWITEVDRIPRGLVSHSEDPVAND